MVPTPYPDQMPRRVILYTRAGCHLCDEAARVVSSVCDPSQVQTIDIDTDPTLRDRYGDKVPVVTVDGSAVGFWRIDPDILRQALA